MDKPVELSKHFVERCKDRLGISKKNASTWFERAYKDGLKKEEFKNNKLIYNYLCTIIDEEDDIDCIIYHHYIIVLRIKVDKIVAVTLLNIPHKYINLVEIVLERRKRNERQHS